LFLIPGKRHWISTTTGISGIIYVFGAARNYARTEVYISKGEAEENELIFDKLAAQKDAIEEITGELEWERLQGKKACRIKHEIDEVSVYNREDWPRMSVFLTESMLKLESAFREPLQRISREIN